MHGECVQTEELQKTKTFHEPSTMPDGDPGPITVELTYNIEQK